MCLPLKKGMTELEKTLHLSPLNLEMRKLKLREVMSLMKFVVNIFTLEQVC